MKRLFFLLALTLSAFGFSQEQYLGIYMQGNKLGYSAYLQGQETVKGQVLTRTDSKTRLNAGLLGTAMIMEILSTSWTNAQGRPVRIQFTSTSAGRQQTVDATFSADKVQVSVDNNGEKSKKTLTIPKDGVVVDDPLASVVSGNMKPGSKQAIYVLDPTTVTLIKNEVVLKGAAKVTVKGRSFDATRVDIVDPRLTTTVYLSAKGDLIKADGPMGMEMIPESKEEALEKPDPNRPMSDLAVVTSLKTDKPIGNPAQLTGLKLRITGRDLSRVPSDQHQTVTGAEQIWVVDVHPQKLTASPGLTVKEAAAKAPEWLKPSMHIPSNQAKFTELAARVVGQNKTVREAAAAIQDYVYTQMKPNAGIGVLRDASEVLESKEGVCRDYAILTATLMRAAGIPTKLCSGLVSWDNSFYYHAWVEVYDGNRWLGIDSTTPRPQITPSHIKLAQGNVEEAFTFTFLDRVKVEVLEIRKD